MTGGGLMGGLKSRAGIVGLIAGCSYALMQTGIVTLAVVGHNASFAAADGASMRGGDLATPGYPDDHAPVESSAPRGIEGGDDVRGVGSQMAGGDANSRRLGGQRSRSQSPSMSPSQANMSVSSRRIGSASRPASSSTVRKQKRKRNIIIFSVIAVVLILIIVGGVLLWRNRSKKTPTPGKDGTDEEKKKKEAEDKKKEEEAKKKKLADGSKDGGKEKVVQVGGETPEKGDDDKDPKKTTKDTEEKDPEGGPKTVKDQKSTTTTGGETPLTEQQQKDADAEKVKQAGIDADKQKADDAARTQRDAAEKQRQQENEEKCEQLFKQAEDEIKGRRKTILDEGMAKHRESVIEQIKTENEDIDPAGNDFKLKLEGFTNDILQKATADMEHDLPQQASTENKYKELLLAAGITDPKYPQQQPTS